MTSESRRCAAGPTLSIDIRLASVAGQAPVPEERLQPLVHMAERVSTEYQTLAAAIPVSGRAISGGLFSETADEGLQ